MIAANRLNTATLVGTASKPPELRNSTHAINATAPPPTPLKSATICGIWVILTRRAAGTATTTPRTTPSTISRTLERLGRIRVAAIAIAIPVAASRLPRTAVLGPVRFESP